MKGDVTVYRLASETAEYKAKDMSGAGAASSGGRWNAVDVPMVYTSETRALAVLETLVHLSDSGSPRLPFNRYLFSIVIPAAIWAAREAFDADRNVGWDAIPASLTATEWGTDWAKEDRSLIAQVPSVVVPEEFNILLNPRHSDARKIAVSVDRRWLYDPRSCAF